MASSGREKGAGYLDFLGVACLLACAPVFFDGAVGQTGFLGDGQLAMAFFAALGAGLLLCGLALALMPVLGPRGHARVTAILGGVLAGGSLALFDVWAKRGSDPDAGSVGLGLACGIGLVLLGDRWRACLTCLTQRDAFRAVSVGLAVGFVQKILMLTLLMKIQAKVVAATLVFAGVVFCVRDFMRKTERMAGSAKGSHSLSIDDLRVSFADNWVSLCYFCPFVVLVAFSWSGALMGGEMQNNPSAETSWGIAWGCLVASVLIGLLSRERLRRWTSVSFVALPLMCVVVLLVSRFMGRFEGGVLQVVTNIPLGFTLMTTGMLTVLRFAGESDKTGATCFSLRLALSAYAALFLFSFLAWPLLGDVVADGLCTSAFVVCMALAVLRMQGGSRVGNVGTSMGGETGVTIPGGFDLDARVKEVAAAASLSPREREVLGLLAEGRTTTYIAEKQYVTTNTVRTHVKRIYAKAGVSSRQELLDLLYHR